jgi:hypothetical protein
MSRQLTSVLFVQVDSLIDCPFFYLFTGKKRTLQAADLLLYQHFSRKLPVKQLVKVVSDP